jgi:hypothetical protein
MGKAHERRRVPFREPVRGDWSFWVCLALTVVAVALGFVQHEGAISLVDWLSLAVFVPLTWFVLSFVIGLPVAMVRQFRAGWGESRARRSDVA